MSVSERLEIVTGHSVRMWVADKVSWLGAYRIGYREPRFPVPSVIGRVYILPQPEMKPDRVLITRYTPNSTPDNPRFADIAWL